MNMQQEDAIRQANDVLKSAFTNFYGSVRFNLHPHRQEANVNVTYTIGDADIEQSKKLTDRKG